MKGFMVLMLVCLASLQIIVPAASSSRSSSSRSGVSQGCSEGELYENDCYLQVSTSSTFHEAQLDCASRNGSLVSINNAEANDFIANLAGGGKVKAWIGATDEETEGVWKWPNGDALEFTSWTKGQPNNYKGRQNCAATNHEGAGQWDDVDCETRRPYICKIQGVTKGRGVTKSTLEDLEAKLTDLEAALANTQAKLTHLEDDQANTQTKVAEVENCLSDISSPDCPSPPIGKTSVAGGISGNAVALDGKCDASTCSDIQEEIEKLKPKFNLVVIAGNHNNHPEIISPSGVCQGIPPLPDNVISAQAVYIDNKLMVCGGHHYWEKRNTCQVLDGSSTQWTQGPTMNEPRTEFTITKVGQDLYALGGYGKGGNGIDSMEKFSVSSGEWTNMNQKLPTPRRSHCTVFMETTNSLVVLGGYMWINDVDVFSLATSTWTQLAPMPQQVKDFGCAVLDQTIVVTGGGTYNANVYQLAEGTWQIIGQLEVARMTFTMGKLDDKLLVIGGWNGEYLDSIEEMQEDGNFKLSKLKLSKKINEHSTTAIPRDIFNC